MSLILFFWVERGAWNQMQIKSQNIIEISFDESYQQTMSSG